MSVFSVGRLCVKKAGRETGKQCVIVDVIDKNYVLVTGPEELTGVRRRRVNVDHIEPLKDKVNIKKNAEDSEVIKALRKTSPQESPSETSPTEVKQKEEPAKPKRRRTKAKKSEEEASE